MSVFMWSRCFRVCALHAFASYLIVVSSLLVQFCIYFDIGKAAEDFMWQYIVINQFFLGLAFVVDACSLMHLKSCT